ncbi:MAG: response regulator [Desulfobacula sp.]|uniref:response regulator n=1 Tax=Desulfobacula sp. TaxID=2593537 RepID=UPI0025BC4349|nr:response regulator [Desulfobacula sp.]MCD4718835.1 response regulator [Desulfobacula sp.]
MIHVLLVSREKTVFKELEAAFSDIKITFDWTDSAQNALSILSKEKFDLFITDEQLPDMTGRDLIEKVLFKNAMMDSVVLSALSHKDFHEAYEGLGVLMQFPVVPGKEQARDLLDHTNRIARIASQTSKPKGEHI